ncbi:hypothetical protein E3N88_11892 [Mikania micrantha]|uniref:Uncharacterized protein n=1 Tax=Mikania micrantha TaxID=192012 RepID=A0A5N6P5Y8_9ASTR|nr:hypothetical protein E3N88_11892 [Mikania micrantha]
MISTVFSISANGFSLDTLGSWRKAAIGRWQRQRQKSTGDCETNGGRRQAGGDREAQVIWLLRGLTGDGYLDVVLLDDDAASLGFQGCNKTTDHSLNQCFRNS